jgi:hypothetical protein
MIGIVEDDGTVTAIYCHWDGYPENNGLLLMKHWNNAYLIDHLMQLGNLSYLGKEIGECQDFDHPTDRNWCLAYGRDRNEPNQTAIDFLWLCRPLETYKMQRNHVRQEQVNLPGSLDQYLTL